MVKEQDYCVSKTKLYISRMTKTSSVNIRVTNYTYRNRAHLLVTYCKYLGEIHGL